MGKGDRYIQRRQELIQRSELMNTLKNRPIDRNWISFTDTRVAKDGQHKLASDIMNKKKHK
jgi:hypothetical protein